VLSKDLGLPSLITEAKREIKVYQGLTSAGAPPPLAGDAAAQPPAAAAAPEVFSIGDLASANAAFQQLVLHIEANKVYYLNQIWAAEIPEVRLARFRLKGIDRYIDNQFLGFVGDKAAYPLRMEALPKGLATYLQETVLGILPDKKKTKKEDTAPGDKREGEYITVPTNGVYMESMLGSCDALDPFILKHRELDVLRATAEVRQAEAIADQAIEEVNRLRGRIKAGVLDDPKPFGQANKVDVEISAERSGSVSSAQVAP